jgi:hypothetical protein
VTLVVAHQPHRPTCRCCDAVLLHFADGEIHVYPQANIPGRLASQLARFVREAIENPSLIPALAMGTPSRMVRRRA